jgi:hypothetical protein
MFSKEFRQRLELGKYTRWAVDLTEQHLQTLLWAFLLLGRCLLRRGLSCKPQYRVKARVAVPFGLVVPLRGRGLKVFRREQERIRSRAWLGR